VNLALGTTAAFLAMQRMTTINGLLINPRAAIVVPVIANIRVMQTTPFAV
jgi:hypothetical protein